MSCKGKSTQAGPDSAPTGLPEKCEEATYVRPLIHGRLDQHTSRGHGESEPDKRTVTRSFAASSKPRTHGWSITQSGKSSWRGPSAIYTDGRNHTHIVRVLDEGPARLAPARVAPHRDVRLEVRNIARLAIPRLLRDGAEKELEGLDEPPLGAGRRRRG